MDIKVHVGYPKSPILGQDLPGEAIDAIMNPRSNLMQLDLV